MGVIFEDEKPQPEKDTRQFYKTYIDDVKECKFKGWSRNMLLVHMSLKAHQNRRTKRCDPSYDVIQKETGLCRASIHDGLTGLKDCGAIEIESKGRKGGGRAHNYKLFL